MAARSMAMRAGIAFEDDLGWCRVLRPEAGLLPMAAITAAGGCVNVEPAESARTCDQRCQFRHPPHSAKCAYVTSNFKVKAQTHTLKQSRDLQSRMPIPTPSCFSKMCQCDAHFDNQGSASNLQTVQGSAANDALCNTRADICN